MYVNCALETFLFFIIFILRFTRGLHEAVFCPKRRITRVDKKSLQNLHKVLDLCGFYGYYMSRYSGIVQSVEQRTVNPYVTGSSPVARAKISAVFRRFFYQKNTAICSCI